MARLTSFSDFVGGETPLYNQPKPYIYVIEYIMGKIDYAEELKEYILNYRDYEDEDNYDSFMEKLKMYVKENRFEEIEDMIINYSDYEDSGFDEDDDDYEEKVYGGDIKDEEDGELSDDLKDFLKIDIEFEDIEDSIDEEFDNYEKSEDIDYEEILEDLDETEDDDKSDYQKLSEEIENYDKDDIFRDGSPIDNLVTEENETEESNRPSYLDKLPLFVHTRNGKKLSERQLEDLIKMVKESESASEEEEEDKNESE